MTQTEDRADETNKQAIAVDSQHLFDSNETADWNTIAYRWASD